jgi:hypothetical protein
MPTTLWKKTAPNGVQVMATTLSVGGSTITVPSVIGSGHRPSGPWSRIWNWAGDNATEAKMDPGSKNALRKFQTNLAKGDIVYYLKASEAQSKSLGSAGIAGNIPPSRFGRTTWPDGWYSVGSSNSSSDAAGLAWAIQQLGSQGVSSVGQPGSPTLSQATNPSNQYLNRAVPTPAPVHSKWPLILGVGAAGAALYFLL